MASTLDPETIEGRWPRPTKSRKGPLQAFWDWIAKWADFIKIEHTIFALPFALSSMALAARENHGWPGWRTFLLILAAMVTGRTCAMIFNRIVDRKFDAINPRTALRHLPTGRISLVGAWTLWALSAAGFVASAYALNRLCFYLSPVALFILCFYSFTKRFTDFTHLFLGLTEGLVPIGAWIAVKGNFVLLPIQNGRLLLQESALLPLLLGIAVVFWLTGFDIIYAIQDYEFDKRHGLHSLVVRWGVKNALLAAFLSHLIMWVLLGVFGFLARFRVAYLIGIALIGACLVIEHWLARRRSTRWLNIAFFRLNAIISTIFLITTLTEIVFPWFTVR